jgi:pyruvate/2-oxoglutarate dehydrogenase complex dihydrolipoamide dehydrogenase (E3) component
MTGDEPSYTVVRAKKVVIATGSTSRLYPPAGTPGCHLVKEVGISLHSIATSERSSVKVD